MAAPQRPQRDGLAGAGDADRGWFDPVDTVIVPYRDLPHDEGAWPRPLIDVGVADMEDVRCAMSRRQRGSEHVDAPLDRGACGDRHARAPTRGLAVAAAPTTAALVPTRLTVAGHSWEAEIGFCDPWPFGWGLLGQLSFFRHFTVTFRAVDLEFELEPINI